MSITAPGSEPPSFEIRNGGPDLQFDDKQLEVLANEYARTNYKGEGFEDTTQWQARALERLASTKPGWTPFALRTPTESFQF